jgi:hypothetical protein
MNDTSPNKSCKPRRCHKATPCMQHAPQVAPPLPLSRPLRQAEARTAADEEEARLRRQQEQNKAAQKRYRCGAGA